ncbi:MAG: hypothetical protein Q9220_002905 [cf. Caloplaca sp. 1 TL-2023]
MAGTGVHNLGSKSDFQTALSDPSLMIIDCMATWCAPCKVIAPEVVKMSNTYQAARFYKMDIDEVPDVAHELGVRGVPAFFLFKNGEKVGEVVGAVMPPLEAAVKKHLEEGAGAKVE